MMDMKWIKIIETGTSKTGKTKIFEVVTNEDKMQILGYISWDGPWRKYIFQSVAHTKFEEVCMRDIADFIQEQTKQHKKQWIHA